MAGPELRIKQNLALSSRRLNCAFGAHYISDGWRLAFNRAFDMYRGEQHLRRLLPARGGNEK